MAGLKGLQRLSAALLREHADDGDRFQDLQLELRVEKTEEILVRVGGVWDRKEKQFVGPAKRSRIIYVHVGQIPAARWFVGWLRGYLAGRHSVGFERIWSMLCPGGRRGGKSDFAVKAAAIFSVAVIGAIVWLVSPAQEETEELKDVLDGIYPADWFKFIGEPKWRYTLATGTRVYLRTGYKPATLKRGRVDLCVINEGQRFAEKAFVMVRGATADTGGLTIVTANPPDEPIGQWVLDFYDEAKAGKRHAVLFEFDAKLNPWVKHESLEDMRDDVDEITFRREVLGEFLSIGDHVFHAWSPKDNVIEVPPHAVDVTRRFTQQHLGRPFENIVGADFQLVPHMAAVILRAYELAPGTEPVLWVVDEVVVEQADEDDLIDGLEAAGYAPDTTCVIADASGAWQDAERTKGRGSYDVFTRRGWRHIYKPDRDAKNNPHIHERIKVGNARMKTADGVRHLFSRPSNEQTNRAIRKWENRNGIPHRRSEFAHLGDALTYPLWRFYPRKSKPRKFEYHKVERELTRRGAEFEGY